VTTLLRIDLAQSPAFTVLEPAQLTPILARMQLDPSAPITYEVALEAARREGIKAIVAGELVQAGPSIVVSARIVAAATGEVLVAVRETADDVSELPDQVDRLSAQLRERVGESLRTIQGDQPLEQVTTASFQALEKYAQADRANNLGDELRALALLEEALAEDSTFAMAHRKLGILLLNTALDPPRRDSAFTHAYELRERLTDRERWLAEAAYLAYVEEDAPASTDRYESLLEAYPTDRVALNNLAIAYRELGRDEEASELYRRSIRNGGAPATTYSGLVPTLYAMGDTAEARRTLEAFRQAYPANPAADELRASFLSAVYDYPGAEEAARSVLETVRGTAAEGGEYLELAQLLLVQGRPDAALDAFRRGLALLDELGANLGITQGAAEALVGGAVALYYAQDQEEAVRHMDRLRADLGVASEPVGDRQDLQFAVVYAHAGRLDRARAMMDAYASEAETGDPRWRLVEGVLAVAEGRAEDGIALIRGARSDEPGCPLCGLSELGRAFDHVAQSDSAVHYFEEYLRTPDMGRLQSDDNFSFWYVVPRLAALHAERGNAERARELYRLFLTATEAAEAQFTPRREQVRSALEALEG
jgi:predicted Zn-dependent protease